MRPGTFTNVGHYIVLYGIDDANQIGVYDPNSASRSARRWGVVEVLNEVEAMWAYYGFCLVLLLLLALVPAGEEQQKPGPVAGPTRP